MNNSAENYVENVSEFIKTVYQFKPQKEIYEGEKIVYENIYYRGQSDKRNLLIPSIARSMHYKRRPALEAEFSFLKIERKIITEAKNKLPNIFTNDLSPLALLAKMQHYGFPTRLLDITENPLVALYFACYGNDKNVNEDGIVYIIKSNEINYIYDAPLLEAFADTSFFKFGDDMQLSDFFDAMLECSYFDKMRTYLKLYAYGNNKDKENYVRDNAVPIVVDSKISTQRQIAQSGKYILFPNDVQKRSENWCFINKISPLKEENEYINSIDKIIIAKENKGNILKELEALNIKKTTLFPDNIGNKIEDIRSSIESQLRSLMTGER